VLSCTLARLEINSPGTNVICIFELSVGRNIEASCVVRAPSDCVVADAK